MCENILELKGITKIFPGVKALDNVHFQLRKGEIHALVGENGAGKSTFIKIISGVHRPEEGTMLLDGKEVIFRNPREAQEAGIATIHQHVTAYPSLTVTENIFIGHEKLERITGRILWKQMHEEANRLLRELGANFDGNTEMGALSVAQQQLVEIAKALSMKARIIIMDEPTAALTKRESEELYKITEKLRDEGVSIIFISHRFEDIYRLSNRVTVFRDAKYIGTYGVNELTNEKLITAMVGREITQLYPKKNAKIGEEVLRVKNLSCVGYFKDVSFDVKQGEILGLTGLVGAGRTEVCETLFGIEPRDEGKIFLNNKEVKIKNQMDAMKLGIGYLPEDRQKQGLILDWGIGQNITLSILNELKNKGFIDITKENQIGKKLSEKLGVKAVSIFDKASSLSGGNQQKVVVAKLLTLDLKVLILDEPTKGVDVGAKAAMYEIMGELANQGYAIIMVSSEMPEIIGMCDRIVVMCEGRVTGVLSRNEATQEKILELAMAKSLHGNEVLEDEEDIMEKAN
ncbi:MAG: sugar ABC transporter ATP-binding protein [Clostridiales bacterium]|nr:sugar ABC transporter ATP-binding protein [Clostridiales bacterium]